MAAALLSEAPERVHWGTDEPQLPALRGFEPMPDEAAMLSAVLHEANARTLSLVLSENPSRLYRFDQRTR